MSTLTSNLEQIYLVKNQIKQVLGTSSDIFTQYPDLISEAISSGGGGLDWDEVASYGYIVPESYTNLTHNGSYSVAQYAYAYVNVAASAGSAYFYLVRNPEEENEEIIPFEDYTAITRYPCFGYNFGNFEYTQGEGAQLVICPIGFEEEGVNKYKIKAQIVSPLFVTSEGGDVASPVDIYVGGPSTIETANDSAEAPAQIGQVGTFESEYTPAIYIARNVSNLELYIEKTSEALPWSARWEWS